MIDLFKAALEDELKEAKTCLIKYGIQALFFTSINGIDIENIPVTLEESVKEMEALEIELICKDPQIIFSALLMDANVVSVPTGEEDTVTGDLKDHPDNTPSLLLLVHTREITHLRTIMYKKKSKEDYCFWDMGWQEVPNTQGYFKNPLKN